MTVLVVLAFFVGCASATVPTAPPDPFPAAVEGDVDRMAALLDAGANPNATDEEGRTPLIRAAANGHRGVVELLVGAGADVETQNMQGQTALMYASQNGHREVVEYLLDAGADPAIRAADGATALFFAAAFGRPEIAALLLQRGSDPGIRTIHEQTPLMAAAFVGDSGSTLLLLDAGGDPGATDEDGRSAFSYAIMRGQFSVARMLVEAGADPDLIDVSGFTLLMSAVANDSADAVAFLLDQAGADVDGRHESGVTALHFAAVLGHLEMIDTLLAHGANPNAATVDGQTPLMAAASKGMADAAVLLIEAGADYSLLDARGVTAAGLAYRAEQQDTAAAILQFQAGEGTGEFESTFLPFEIRPGDSVALGALLETPVSAVGEIGFDLGPYPDHPDEIQYVSVSEEDLTKAVHAFFEYCDAGDDVFAENQPNGLTILGPRLTTLLNRGGYLRGVDVQRIYLHMQAAPGATLAAVGARGDSIPFAARVVRHLVATGDTVEVRRLSSLELDWYWAAISWDVEEPVFVVDTGPYSVLVDLDEAGGVFFVELIQGLEWAPVFGTP